MVELGQKTFEGRVKKDWLDYNGHMNVGFYLVVFDKGTDGLFEILGVGERAMKDHGETIFVIEAHITYQNELVLDQEFYILTQLSGFDHNKLQYVHCMYDGATDELVATNECICLNVDVESRKAKKFRSESVGIMESLVEQQKDSQLFEEYKGRSIRQLGFPSVS